MMLQQRIFSLQNIQKTSEETTRSETKRRIKCEVPAPLEQLNFGLCVRNKEGERRRERFSTERSIFSMILHGHITYQNVLETLFQVLLTFFQHSEDQMHEKSLFAKSAPRGQFGLIHNKKPELKMDSCHLGSGGSPRASRRVTTADSRTFSHTSVSVLGHAIGSPKPDSCLYLCDLTQSTNSQT